MRQTTYETPPQGDDFSGHYGTIHYPNSVAFMYSRLPVILQEQSAPPQVRSVRLELQCEGRRHTETRATLDGRAEFDIRRAVQLLSPSIDDAPQRADAGQSLGAEFQLSLMIYSDIEGEVEVLAATFTALYGALDQGEIYGEHTQRRLWLNYPQTFALWHDDEGELAFVTDDAYIYPDADGVYFCERDFVQALKDAGETKLLQELRNGKPLLNLGLTWRSRVADGHETVENMRTVTLVPDNTRRGAGTYLRWLNRRGELSYFLFTNSKVRMTSTVSETFTRYYDGDPATYDGGVFVNPQKANYREAREMVLGATGLSLDEYEDLCDLATSPVVERLMPDAIEDAPTARVFDGGDAAGDASKIYLDGETATTEVGDGDARSGQVPVVNRWQRVNVAAGTFERSIRRTTPSRQDLEIIIELPERNTVQL